MREFLLKSAMLASIIFLITNAYSQSGSGWDWVSTSTKATPSPGRQVRDIVTDAAGNIYAIGDFQGSMTIGGITLTSTGDGSNNFNYDADVFIAKYDVAGNVLWAKQHGRAGTALNHRGEVITIDGNGNIYAGGNAGVPFLNKYDNNGNLLWTKSFTLYDLGGINVSPDGNPIIMESNQSSKNIYKIDKTTGNILWTVSNTGVGSNSTTTFQESVDVAGNVYYTAFGTGAVTVAGQNFSSAVAGTSYIASVDNNGATRWVDQLEGAQVQLGYTIDKNGKSYVIISGGFGGNLQGVGIGGCAACGAHYLELNANGAVTYSSLLSPYKGAMRVTDNAVYSFGVNAGTNAGTYTEVYGENIIKSKQALGQDLGVIAKYDVTKRQTIWGESYEANGANYLKTIEPAINGKVLVGGAYQTSIKFGANLFTPTIVGQANYFPLDMFIAQFNPSNLLPSPTTTWTGAASNGSWTDAGNWSTGAPNGNEKAIIPSGVANYPTNITTSNYTGKLTVQSGVTITLPVGFDAPGGIINNGTIEVKGTGTFQGFNTSQLAPLTGTGRLLFTANSPSTILYDITTNSLEINKPAGTIQWNGGVIGGSLFITAGILNGANPVTLTNPNATITYSPTAYMIGTLKRAINSSGTYVFPIGGETQYGGGPTMYAPVTITLNNVTGPQFVTANFPGFAATTGTTPNINMGGGNTITTKLNNNLWNITPDVALTGGSYSISLQAGGYTNGVTDATRYVIIKRKDNTSAWSFDGTNGTSTQTAGTTNGGVVSNGTVNASLTGLTSFSTFIIGIASASVPAGTAVTTSNWTGNAGNSTWNNAGNWDNGIPNGLINAKIPAGKATYPTVYLASDNARSVQNDATTNVKLPYNFIINGDLINNGTIEVIGTTGVTFNGFGTSSAGYATLSGTGKLLFSVNSPNNIFASINNALDIDKPSSALYTQGATSVAGNINIINGMVYTSASYPLTMLSPTATITASATSHIQSLLNRAVNANGTYLYPVGEGNGRFSPVTITTSGLAGTTQLSVAFVSGGGATVASADSLPVYTLDAGKWTITPNNAATAGTLNATFEARGSTNAVVDASRYVLLKTDGVTGYVRVDNAVITQSGGVVTATINSLPALTAPITYAIGIKGTTSQWTGATNAFWTTASNWTNGIPDDTKKAVFVTGSPIYPASPASRTSAGMLDNSAGVTIKLPDNFVALQGLANNGTIEVINSNTYPYAFSGYNKLSGTGKLLFTSLSPQEITSGVIINNGVELNRARNYTTTNVTINGTLTLTTGIMVGNVTLTNPTATVGYSGTSYILGSLKRKVNTSGVYTFPIGAADRFVPATLTLNNLTGPQNITLTFSSTINGAAPNTTAENVPVTQLLNAGIWTVAPDVQTTGGSYTLTLEGRGYTNAVSDPARYVVLRRDASNYNWGYYGSNGVATQSNNVITATGNMTGFLREYGIGIAGSAVAATLPVTISKFEVTKSGASVDVIWQTATEHNSNKFIIERSADGNTFSAIGEVKAIGSSNQLHNYSFRDNSPLQKTNHYRLRQLDFDGRTALSGIRIVRFDENGQVSTYPNPVYNTIKIDGIGSVKYTYQLIDLNGQVMSQGALLNNGVSVPATIKNGMYVIKLISAQNVVTTNPVIINR